MIIGSKFIFIKSLASTNALANRMLKETNVSEGTVIYTDYQSKGKGQPGNRWESEAGKNLLLTIILFPSFIDPEDQFIISMTISLGISDFLKKYIEDCRIKWPNDIYAGNGKICGILILNSIMGKRIENSVVGIGLNINQEKFIKHIPNPVSLKLLTGHEYNTTICLGELTTEIDKRYEQLLSGMSAEIRQEYISSLYRYNEWSPYKTSSGILTGRIISVTDSGRLLIEDQNSVLHEFSFREIEFMQS